MKEKIAETVDYLDSLIREPEQNDIVRARIELTRFKLRCYFDELHRANIDKEEIEQQKRVNAIKRICEKTAELINNF